MISVKNSNPSYMADFCRSALPANRGLYYDGGWHEAQSGRHISVESPGTGESLGEIADGDAADIAAVVASARSGFRLWRDVHPSGGRGFCGGSLRSYGKMHANWRQLTRSTVAILLLR